MNKITLVLIAILISHFVLAQDKIHKKCGPAIYLQTRTYLQNDSLNGKPFDAIVHVNMKGWGTATFINDSTLITAKHIADKSTLKKIDIYKNVYKDDTVQNDYVELKSSDFKVKNVAYDKCHFISSDISYVVLTQSGRQKMRTIYTNHMEIADYKTLNLDSLSIITLTGYPVDLAGKGQNKTDILASKKTVFKDLLFDKSCKMVGYRLFTCSGDSGAPLWVEVNGKFYVIAIHHGGPEKGTVFNKEKRNSAALIRSEILIYDK